MTPTEFLKVYSPFAEETQRKYGVPAKVTLAQAALESGWGKHAPGFNFFGVKAGEKQLLRTTEYLKTPDVKFPEVISITPENGKYKYIVKDYFRKYKTPGDSFDDHAQFLLVNPRYKAAFAFTNNPEQFINEIAKAGYATDSKYAEKLNKLASGLESVIKTGVEAVKENPAKSGLGLLALIAGAYLLSSQFKKRKK